MKRGFSALCLAANVLAGCGGGGAPSATPTPRLHNPLDFPLYANAALISVKSFRKGHEVIAESPASFDDLSAWVDRLNAAPPPGYAAVEDQSNADEQAQAQEYGLDYALFKRKAAKSTRGVLVVVMDPVRVHKRFGAILGMIDRYRALPALFRAPLDSAAKARYGMTITQATQPDNPVGAALAALDELQHTNARGILVLDAQKL
jgi:hypothetical protein